MDMQWAFQDNQSLKNLLAVFFSGAWNKLSFARMAIKYVTLNTLLHVKFTVTGCHVTVRVNVFEMSFGK